MAKKVKVEAVPELNEEQLNENVKRYTLLDNEEMSLQAEMNQKIDEVKAMYKDRINELAAEKKEVVKVVHAWAEKNKSQFEKKRSRELLFGRIGFRLGTYKLGKDKGLTWEAVTRIAKVMRAGKPYIRIKEELDKEMLLANRQKPEVITLMKEVGVFVQQDETFFIEPKQESLV